MGSRSTFLHHLEPFAPWGDGVWKDIRLVVPVPGERRPVGKSAGVMCDLGGLVRGTVWKCVREKPRSEGEEVTVPKLTQVGGLNIPRRSREPSLRNSAKWPRKFARRGACESRSQRSDRSDCLLKTQVPAKSNRRRIGTDACPLLER